jgi:hypothetical protein
MITLTLDGDDEHKVKIIITIITIINFVGL